MEDDLRRLQLRQALEEAVLVEQVEDLAVDEVAEFPSVAQIVDRQDVVPTPLVQGLDEIAPDMPLSRDEFEAAMKDAARWNFKGKSKQGKSQIVEPGEELQNERDITLEELKQLTNGM